MSSASRRRALAAGRAVDRFLSPVAAALVYLAGCLAAYSLSLPFYDVFRLFGGAVRPLCIPQLAWALGRLAAGSRWRRWSHRAGRYMLATSIATWLLYAAVLVQYVEYEGLGRSVPVLAPYLAPALAAADGKAAGFRAWLLSLAFLGAAGVLYVVLPERRGPRPRRRLEGDSESGGEGEGGEAEEAPRRPWVARLRAFHAKARALAVVAVALGLYSALIDRDWHDHCSLLHFCVGLGPVTYVLAAPLLVAGVLLPFFWASHARNFGAFCLAAAAFGCFAYFAAAREALLLALSEQQARRFVGGWRRHPREPRRLEGAPHPFPSDLARLILTRAPPSSQLLGTAWSGSQLCLLSLGLASGAAVRLPGGVSIDPLAPLYSGAGAVLEYAREGLGALLDLLGADEGRRRPLEMRAPFRAWLAALACLAAAGALAMAFPGPRRKGEGGALGSTRGPAGSEGEEAEGGSPRGGPPAEAARNPLHASSRAAGAAGPPPNRSTAGSRAASVPLPLRRRAAGAKSREWGGGFGPAAPGHVTGLGTGILRLLEGEEAPEAPAGRDWAAGPLSAQLFALVQPWADDVGKAAVLAGGAAAIAAISAPWTPDDACLLPSYALGFDVRVLACLPAAWALLALLVQWNESPSAFFGGMLVLARPGLLGLASLLLVPLLECLLFPEPPLACGSPALAALFSFGSRFPLADIDPARFLSEAPAAVGGALASAAGMADTVAAALASAASLANGTSLADALAAAGRPPPPSPPASRGRRGGRAGGPRGRRLGRAGGARRDRGGGRVGVERRPGAIAGAAQSAAGAVTGAATGAAQTVAEQAAPALLWALRGLVAMGYAALPKCRASIEWRAGYRYWFAGTATSVAGCAVLFFFRRGRPAVAAEARAERPPLGATLRRCGREAAASARAAGRALASAARALWRLPGRLGSLCGRRRGPAAEGDREGQASASASASASGPRSGRVTRPPPAALAQARPHVSASTFSRALSPP
eukprot:tig00020610_g11968.t1